MTQSKNTLNVETLIAASMQHGQDSEPDHEAGDLQEFLREGWSLLDTDQRKFMLIQPRLKSAVETAAGKKLRITKVLLKDKGVDQILDIFEQHGIDEGAEAEITDLQDALRTCWGVLTEAQRAEMLELDSVQETFENATTKPMFRYLASPG